MPTYEEDVVYDIRRNNGVDDSSENSVVQNLKQNLKHSLQVLHEDLYSRPAHFVLELIQNADDNHYDTGVIPELRIILSEDYIEIRCNEIGFTEENVRAFCAIGKSTKRNQTGYIGEKGIGVKSMFQVADRVYVQSRGYSFSLDRDDELGIISPRWAADFAPIPGWTRMQLRFRDDKQFAIVKEQLEEVRSTVLLFMRRLGRLCIDVRTEPPFIAWREIYGDTVTIHMSGGDAPYFSFIRVAQEIPAYRDEPKRPNSTSTEVMLAFPLSSNQQPWMSDQAVYAFLPLRRAGFTFMIQADFLTTANREDILWKLPWNLNIRDHIAQIFLSAVFTFNKLPQLELTWFRFLPLTTSVRKDFFAPVARGILDVVRKSEVVKCTDGIFRKPASVKFCASFSYEGRVLIQPEHLPFSYAAFEYPDDVKPRLKDLGVDTMTLSDFVSALILMGENVTENGNGWLEIVCYMLCMEGTAKHAKDSSWKLHDERILDLPFALSRNGQWTRPDAKTMFFDEKNLPFPDGLDISLLQSHSASPWRRQLLERVGIKDVDEKIVIDRILDVHRRPSPPLTAADMLEHALYVFERRHNISRELKNNSLWLPNATGGLFRGKTLYISNPRSFAPLRDILESPAEFIHDSFLSPQFALAQPSSNVPDWLAWLQGNLGVSSSLRVEPTGRPTQEFMHLVDRLRLQDCERLLLILKENWPGIQEQFATPTSRTNLRAYFSSVQVRCRHGIDASLSSTMLPYYGAGQLKADDFPQLPVPEPLHDWEFLSLFGVSISQDASFYLKALIAVAKSGERNPASVRKLYKQLEARFDDIPHRISVEFDINKLILIDGKWLSSSQVVWNGPAVMKLKTPLQPHYPGLDELFHVRLRIPDASDSAIADELQDFVVQHRGRPISHDSKTRLIHLLEYAASTIELIQKSECNDWTRSIINVPFFPVRRLSSTSLSSREGQFYLADSNGTLEDIFAPHLPFLDIRPEHAIRLRPLFEFLDIEGKRIERCVSETVLVESRSLAAELDANYLRRNTHYQETMFYHSRIPFFQRLQFYRLSTAVTLQSIRVLNVRQLALSYTLQGQRGQRPLSLSRPRQCWARQCNGELQLFVVSSLSPKLRHGTSVAEALAACLGLPDSDIPSVAAILRFEPDEVNELLHKSGVRELDPKRVPPSLPPPVDERETHNNRSGHSGPSDRQTRTPQTPAPSLQPPASLSPTPSNVRGLSSPTISAAPSLVEQVLPGFVPAIRAVVSPAPPSPSPVPSVMPGASLGLTASVGGAPRTRPSAPSRLSDTNSQVSTTRSSLPERINPPTAQTTPRAIPSTNPPATPVTPVAQAVTPIARSPPFVPPVVAPSPVRPSAPPISVPSSSAPSSAPSSPSTTSFAESTASSRDSSPPRRRRPRRRASSSDEDTASSPVATSVPLSIPPIVQDNTSSSLAATTRVPRSRWILQEDEDARSFIGTDEGRAAIQDLQDLAKQMNIPAALTTATLALTPYGTPPSSPPPSPPASPRVMRSTVAAPGNRSSGRTAADINASSVGFIGENYVYDLLRHHLPSFDMNNWTSELRVLAGLPEFTDPESQADFTYRDTEGALTSLLYPEGTKNPVSLPANTEYLIEVKTTTGDQTEPFFMSRRQFQKAYLSTRHGRTSAVQKVYVIFRVSRLLSGVTPELKIYDDPHAMLAQGTLQIESDQVQVRVA